MLALWHTQSFLVLFVQYKIPVQIENEDTIFLGLSLRQLAIIMVGAGFAYSIFKNLEPQIGGMGAGIPAIAVLAIFILVAIFRSYEMTFTTYFLNFLRLNLNERVRVWSKGIDSVPAMDIGYLSRSEEVIVAERNRTGAQVYDEISEKLTKI